MTGPVFQVSTALDADVAGLRLVGALDLDGTAQLLAAVADCFARQPDRVVLDLSALRFCDCAGLNVLVEAKVTADRIGTDLRVDGARTQVARLFALAGVEELFAAGVPRLPPRTL
ncbi:STAS domain-containing protein [Streptomyces sp. MB09-01]|uniref:STAS domain-containing protein n=1 Tax=Streptomyces sp. MB09-01 TaxID=3028666 RepID=UPI0029BD43D8|nr:STAS domain-containing protein [Streptomyces sp. MB09-01]MDX3533765.1 STAS domain-containing protein [Streptomyces sp. MB09-01]